MNTNMKTIHPASLLLAAVGLAMVAAPAGAADGPAIAPGPFTASAESLKAFKCPDWFRDAKFGIWAHWGPQAVPMAGDWYARHLYTEDNKRGQYQHHLENYGHPSVHGWKDVIPLWKAEKFDPDRLMALYKAAGARYFVSMGVHHDNFDLWNSKHHRWNAVQTGPKRDIVGEWQKAAKKQGLPFGVSEHLGASFWWWQVNKGADTKGPKAGVPYDGNDPKFEDLYHWKAAPGDTGPWYADDARWHQTWFKRIKDLVDSYQPDLLYTDGGVPFGAVGRSLVAHFYNADLKRNGRLGVVYTCKDMPKNKGEFVAGCYVQDMERGVLPGINPLPWQTDTSIGDWFYNKNWKTKDTGKMYRSADWVVRTLVDIVSKNGNLLLNVIQRPDGSLDPEVEQLLADIGAWMKNNGEAIYGTRPWQIYGEGAIKAEGGHFKEDFAFSARDIRFTTKGRTLYAIALGWPEDGRIVVRSLARPAGAAGGRVTTVALLGHAGKLPFAQDAAGLVVTLPAAKISNIAVALKIEGDNLRPIESAN
jgi:alpha-L-fucosidase